MLADKSTLKNNVDFMILIIMSIRFPNILLMHKNSVGTRVRSRNEFPMNCLPFVAMKEEP